jgi:hypothetical protein
VGVAAYNRGSRVIRRELDATIMKRGRYCGGRFTNGPGKRYARCVRCRRIDYEANEGDRCSFLIV